MACKSSSNGAGMSLSTCTKCTWNCSRSQLEPSTCLQDRQSALRSMSAVCGCCLEQLATRWPLVGIVFGRCWCDTSFTFSSYILLQGSRTKHYRSWASRPSNAIAAVLPPCNVKTCP